MEDKLEKKLKEFLPYIIILGATFLLLPFLLRLLGNNVIINNIVLMGVFPVVTFGCNFYYTYSKRTDNIMVLIAPILFVPAMFLHGIFADSVLNSIIYLIAYLVSGYIGVVIAEMVKGNNKKDNEDIGYTRKKRNIPQKVNTVSHEAVVEDDFSEIEMPVDYNDYEDTVTVNEPKNGTEYDEYDIDAILAEIQSRRD